MFDALHFIRPWWLLALPLGTFAIAGYALRARRASGAWVSVVDDALQPFVLESGQAQRRNIWSTLLALAIVWSASFALAGPSWERQSVPLSRASDAMIIALDLSRSMDATDVEPSRLVRARLKLLDILRLRAGGDTGLIVYSANAFVVTPLTSDVATIAALVPSLTTSLMPSRGSYPDAALEKALQLFEQSSVSAGRILFITDGGNLAPAMTAMPNVRAQGHEVSVLAVGTADGGPIPRPRGGFLTDPSGNIAVPVLERGPLQQLAAAGGGRFAVMGSNSRDIEALQLGVRTERAVSEDDNNRSIERWLDRGPWLLLLLLPLVALTFRRGGYALVALLAVGVAPRAEAGFWQDLWRTRDQQAAALLEQGDAERAAQLFDDPDWQASAAYQAGNYADAAQTFAARRDVDGLYNAGTALARAGEFDAAIETLQAALQIDPEHADARFNLDLLQSMQNDDSSQSNQGDSDEQSSQQQSGDGNGDQSQSADSAGAGEGSDGNDAGRNAQADDAEQEAIEALQRDMRAAEEAGGEAQQNASPEPVAMMSEAQREAAEQQQALENWLRQVEDDPGGLLRRKFRYQYQRRQTDQDGVRLWPDDRSEPW